MSDGEIVLYNTEDGLARVQLRAADGTVWLTQAQIAELFDTTKQNVSLHLRNLLAERELAETSVVKESLTTAADGKAYGTLWYSLEAILAVGYRVRSARGVQFRQWATTRLREYLVKGFVLDEQRLREPGPFDYFDELLEKIRDIRASEKRFYQKVRDVYATAADYDGRSETAQIFFATVQNNAARRRGQDSRRADCRPRQCRRPEHGLEKLERRQGSQGRRRYRQELPER